jgi:hypothetical protein
MGSIRLATLVKMDCPLGVIGCLVTPLGNHGSFHMLILKPSPTLQIIPDFMACKPCTMLLREYDMPGFSTALRRLPSG